MILKHIIDEDFINYKKPSMFIAFPKCDWKCEKECGERVCQNGALANSPNIEIEINDIVERYINNPLTTAIVLGGLEPFDSWEDLYSLIDAFRKKTNDDIVIYTGYNEFDNHDFNCQMEILICSYKNIVIKFGRFIPNQTPHYDEVLGVTLASDNQYAMRW